MLSLVGLDGRLCCLTPGSSRGCRLADGCRLGRRIRAVTGGRREAAYMGEANSWLLLSLENRFRIFKPDRRGCVFVDDA